MDSCPPVGRQSMDVASEKKKKKKKVQVLLPPQAKPAAPIKNAHK